MRLAVNGWRTQGKRTGIARYLLNVVRHWTPPVVSERFSQIGFYVAHDADRSELGLPAGVDLHALASPRPMLVWENTRFARAADEEVAFHPSFSIPLVRRGRTVVTTHDMVMELHPTLFSPDQRRFYNRLYRWSARHATLVITDSQASRDDMVRLWGIPESRIRVVYLAPDEIFGPLEGDQRVAEARQRFIGGDEPFFLFVGKLSGRRNVPLLVDAFAELKRRRADVPHKLLLIGMDVHGLDVRSRARDLGLGDAMVHHEYISDDDLVALYNAAEAYVTPSAYETTSLPALESQVSRTPVITIDTPGMREITGGAAVLIPRLEVRELAEAMERTATDGDLRARLADEGARSVARFTWQRSSTDTLDVLEEAARLPAHAARPNRPLAAS
ncbi:MAG: glycosyltransferase family 4 protein [Solirubrobacteraceae bacterium]